MYTEKPKENENCQDCNKKADTIIYMKNLKIPLCENCWISLKELWAFMIN